ncbi:hypothetical protein JAO29_20950 [Edaphobacter sp. HDX4]|uniref:hypothetical protein n=1 Tax=Edaphobacter sp. HDX4 TaxID=2794064 RepID=UPI002FE5FCFB
MTNPVGDSVAEVCMTGTFNSHGWVALAVTVIGVIAAISSLAKGFQWLREETAASRGNRQAQDRWKAKSWLLGLWVIAPPMWLYIEAIFLYRHFGRAACFGQFQYAQQIVFRGWVVLIAVLGPLYFGREILSRE